MEKFKEGDIVTFNTSELLINRQRIHKQIQLKLYNNKWIQIK